jgi:hypothetical protein
MHYDDETRARVVRDWMHSTRTQTDFCAERGISTRALRSWTRRLGVGERPHLRLLAVLDEAVRNLLVAREGLAAEVACRSSVAETCGDPQRHAESDGGDGGVDHDREDHLPDPVTPRDTPRRERGMPSPRKEHVLALGAEELVSLVQAVQSEFREIDTSGHQAEAPCTRPRKARGSFFADLDVDRSGA